MTVDEVNNTLISYTKNNHSFGYNSRYIVSSDIIGTTYGSVFDPTQTEVTQSGEHQLVKIVA